jgi:hypothetical protein
MDVAKSERGRERNGEMNGINMEEKGSDRKRKGWEIGKMLIFGVVFLFVIRIESTEGK